MNTSRLVPLVALTFLSLGIAASAFAAAPVASSLYGESILQGETAVLRAQLTDADTDLDRVEFYVNGPGLPGWTALGVLKLSGNNSSADLAWRPPALGIYTARIEVYDRAGNGPNQSATARLDTTFEVFTQRLIVKNLMVASGEMRVFNSDGEIRTKENLATTEVLLQPGATAVLWAKSRIVLKPGFRAQSGSVLWAAVDTDMDGYSDVEEATDTDGDGIPDAWEFDHGLDPLTSDLNTDTDGDGVYNPQEYRNGTDVRVKDNPVFRLVIFSPVS